MAKRIKKPPVKPEVRQSWMKRHEQGESITDIAANDKFDARTVRRHIELAKQQREVKEARSIVLRNALEAHYSDLCSYAEKLSVLESGEVAAESTREAYIHQALRQHLPRSPIWGYLRQRDNLKQQIDQLMQEAGMKLEKVVKSDLRLSPGLDNSEIGVVPGIVVVLKFQIEQWAKGNPGLNVKDNLIEEKTEEGFVNLRYGFSHMGKVKKEHIGVINKVLRDLESHVKEWEECKKLEKSFMELKRVERNLRDELAGITLRRIVPGRCRYCPL
jgi:hypothetical protein